MPKKTIKKSVKKSSKEKVVASKVSKFKEGKLVGQITHYFSEIGVAVIKIVSPIKEGEEIRIIGGENTDFIQDVSSMQIDHEKVKSAKKGADVGLKVKEKVREGYKVYKV
jgi:putative protease